MVLHLITFIFLDPIYEELLELPVHCTRAQDVEETPAKVTRPPLLRQEVVSDSPKHNVPPPKPPPLREKSK
jgi:hypothetical protein